MDIAAVIKASCRQEVKIQAIVRVLHQAVHLFDCFPGRKEPCSWKNYGPGFCILVLMTMYQ